MPCPKFLLRFSSLSPGHILSVGSTLTPERTPQSPMGSGQPKGSVASYAAWGEMRICVLRYLPPSAGVPGIPLAFREGKLFMDRSKERRSPRERKVPYISCVTEWSLFSVWVREERSEWQSHRSCTQEGPTLGSVFCCLRLEMINNFLVCHFALGPANYAAGPEWDMQEMQMWPPLLPSWPHSHGTRQAPSSSSTCCSSNVGAALVFPGIFLLNCVVSENKSGFSCS